MSNSPVKEFKVKKLPKNLQPSSLYYVKVEPNKFKIYLTDSKCPPTAYSLDVGDSVKIVTSPDGSIQVVETATETQIQVSAAIIAQINSALQSGDNVSELTNDAGYITIADVPEFDQNNFVRELSIFINDLPEDYTEEDIINYILALPPEERTITETDSKWNIVIGLGEDTVGKIYELKNIGKGLIEELDSFNNLRLIYERVTFNPTDYDLEQFANNGSDPYAHQSEISLKENLSNKAIDFSIVNDTLYPSVQAAKTYADNLVVGLLNDRGSWDASSNLFPTTGGSGTSGAIRKGDMWFVSVGGILAGKTVTVGDSFRALVNTPAQTASNWSVLEANIGYVPENIVNKSDSFTLSSSTTYSTTKALVDGLATKQATIGYTPANDALVAHLAGTETFTGAKVFQNYIEFGNGTDVTRISRAAGAGGRLVISRPGSLAEAISIGGGASELNIRGTMGSIAHTGNNFGITNSGSGIMSLTASAGDVEFNASGASSGVNLKPGGITSLRAYPSRNVGIQNGGTFTDDGVNRLQVNGTIKASPATLSDQVVVKSQLDALDSAMKNLTGWAQYSDNVYTVGSPLVINSGTTTALTNNGATSITTQMPTGVTAFVNTANGKITPQNDGDFYLVDIRFKAKSSSVNGVIDVGIDIGGAMGVIREHTVVLRKGIGVEQRVSLSFPVYSGATFVANGGQVKVTSVEGDTSIYDITFVVDRTHKAK